MRCLPKSFLNGVHFGPENFSTGGKWQRKWLNQFKKWPPLKLHVKNFSILILGSLIIFILGSLLRFFGLLEKFRLDRETEHMHIYFLALFWLLIHLYTTHVFLRTFTMLKVLKTISTKIFINLILKHRTHHILFKIQKIYTLGWISEPVIFASKLIWLIMIDMIW